jgi:hypothetical protein
MEEDNLKIHLERVDKKISQLHDYTRSTMQHLVTWFTFFVTVNSASIAWLAPKPPLPSNLLISLISVMFIIQNLLGIAACLFVRQYIHKTNKKIADWELLVFKNANYTRVQFPSDTCVPVKLYLALTLLMAVSLLIMAVAWYLFYRVFK